MKFSLKKLRKVLAMIAALYRVIAAIIEALNPENPGNNVLPEALQNNKKPK